MRQGNGSPIEKSTLLYIEDNPGNIMLMQRILAQRTSLELVTAINGKQGLTMAAEMQPALILTDISLPDIDGFEVFKRLQNNPQLKEIPVIALSGNVMPEDINNGLEQGFTAYLAKPVNIGALLQLLGETLGRDIT
jgi:CheY-like chemotaxis protein